MAILHVMHGLPGTGKTTFAKSLASKCQGVLLSNDEWMIELFGRNPPAADFAPNFEAIERLQLNIAKVLLARGVDVIWDYGVWSREQRTRLLERFEGIPHEALFYSFLCAPELADARVLSRTADPAAGHLCINQGALDSFRLKFQPISPEEKLRVLEIRT